MRRSSRLGLALAAVLLVVVLAGYSAFWFVAASRFENGVTLWAQSLRTQDLDLSWRSSRVTGFPLAFALELSDASLRAPNAGEVRLPLLTATASPWNFRVFRLDMPMGMSAASGPGERPAVSVAANSGKGSIAVAEDGAATLWFGLDKPAVDGTAVAAIAARQVEVWLNLPARQPQGHTEPAIGIALDARELSLPTTPAPFVNPLDQVSLGITIMVKIAAASTPPRQAAALWRDSGGTVELDHFRLRWGPLAITGSGTLALDRELQPIGSFSGAIAGYDQLMTALVAAGRMRPGEAGLARLALAMFSRVGPDGRPEIAASFTIQNGEMFLGPAKLGPAPRILWQ
jgi:hypothetical protein